MRMKFIKYERNTYQPHESEKRKSEVKKRVRSLSYCSQEL